MSVRVRFAPSPTGYLHVGGLRTALYNYLFARHNNGKVILRIEDTDRTRLVENAADNLIQSMKWAGIEFDESPVLGGDYGPYVQSERFGLYKKYADELIDKGLAYYAFDTGEELTAMREKQQAEKKDPKYDRDTMRNQFTLGEEETKKLIDSETKYVVRLKVPMENIKFHDLIRGDVTVNGKDIDDQVLLKSDGFPTYHLANVVDDHLMKISHVIRGEEWLPSTPKHVILYKAFGWDVPEFAHLPLLLNSKKQKLSKRHGSVAVEDFKDQGYLKDAFVNFIALLGWNPTADRDIYTMDELISLFNIEKVNKGGAIFDLNKLKWFNEQYLRTIFTEKELVPILKDTLADKGKDNYSDSYLEEVIKLFKERVSFIQDIPDFAPYMFADIEEYEEKYFNKHWKETSADLLRPLMERFRAMEEFNHEEAHTLTKQYLEENEIGFKPVIHPLRLMITGKSVGAGMFETMEVLGKDECIRRMETFLEKHG